MRTKDIVEAYKVDTRRAAEITEQLESVGLWSADKLYSRKDIEAILKKENQ